MERATSISNISQALSLEPLTTPDELDRFYGERFESRESDSTALMMLELNKSHGGNYYRRFLTGHSGSGKSTELSRLSRELEAKFEFLRLSAQKELSPFSTQPFDVIEVMAIRMVERAGQLGIEPGDALMTRLKKWFEDVTESRTSESSRGAAAEGEAGLPGWLKAFLPVALTVKGEAKYSSSRTEEAVRKRLQRISELQDLSNELFVQCNDKLKRKSGQEWVFLIEDFDKHSVSEQVLNTLFIQYSNIWTGIRCHFICTVPLWLTFGEKGAMLPCQRRALVDIPVFNSTHQPHASGRRMLGTMLDLRVAPELFAPGVREHLIQAAGGNLRDMFRLVLEAANSAELAGQSSIERRQADRAVNWLRNEYLRRLGETSAERAIPYEKKIEVLKRIYEDGAKGGVVQDPVLYSLLRSRVVHEYNETYWYGLPPLMVDILIQQGHLPKGSPGGLEPAPQEDIGA